MEDNPYSALVGLMRVSAKESTPVAFRIGVVVNEDPLSIDIGGALQEAEALVHATTSPFVEVTVDTEIATTTPHSHSGGDQSSVTVNPHAHSARVTNKLPRFFRGESLLLVPIEDEQRYIVLARLVGL